MTTFNEADHPRGEAGKFTTKAQSESNVALLQPDKWEAHGKAIEDAVDRVGIRDGEVYEYSNTALLLTDAGEAEATIHLWDDSERPAYLRHNFATGKTKYMCAWLTHETDDKELIRTVVDDICRDHEADVDGMFEHLRQEAAAGTGVDSDVAKALSAGKAERFNTHRAKIGDKIVITRDGHDIQMTVSNIFPAGSGGTSFAAGPHISAHIRPGGYSVSIDATNVDSHQARVFPSDPEPQPAVDEYAAARPFTASAQPKPNSYGGPYLR